MELAERLEEAGTVPEEPESELLSDSCVSKADVVNVASLGGNNDDCELSGVLALLAMRDDEDDGRPAEDVVGSKEVDEFVLAERGSSDAEVVARSVERLDEAEKDVCDGAYEPSDDVGEAEGETDRAEAEDDSRDAKLLDVRADALELEERVLDLQCMIQDQVERSESEKLTLSGSHRSQTPRRS